MTDLADTATETQIQKAIVLARSIPEPNTGCWLWTGALQSMGYGHGRLNRAAFLAHRLSYLVFRGPIPEGLVLDHLCRTPACCNPDHLEAVTHKENLRRGYSGELTTHCPHGHEYTPENTWRNPKGHRFCRACHRVHSERQRRAKGIPIRRAA